MAVIVAVLVLFNISELKAEVGVTDTEILIGSSLALEGHASYLGTETMNGFMSYIHAINEQGGVHGRKIRVIAYNDSYAPEECVKNTNKLIQEDKVFALASYVGTPTSIQAVPIIEKSGVPLVGLFTGAEVFRKPVKNHVFNIRASYYEEVMELYPISGKIWGLEKLLSYIKMMILVHQD